MRQTKRDKQIMYYSNFAGTQKEYEKDADGNTVYVEVDGQLVPVETGIVTEVYDTPVKFKASISSQLNELQIRSWGVDQSAIHSELCVKKGYLPVKIGTIIWRTSEVVMEEDGIHAKASSSDYTVCGIMDEDLYSDFYLLKRNSSDA